MSFSRMSNNSTAEIPRASSSDLIDPKVIAANEGGELTAEQRAKFKSMLPGLGSVFSSFSIFCLIGFASAVIVYIIVSPVLRNWRDPAKAFTRLTDTPSFILVILAVFALMTAILGFVFLRSLLEYLRVRSVLKRGAVRQAEGTILWSGKNYIASFPGNKIPLKVWNDGEIDVVIPGRHQIFYLPLQTANWLLSIKPYPADSAAMQNLFQNLAQANGFDADALESNRRGRLSQNQIYGLKTFVGTELTEGRAEMAEGAARKVLERKMPSKERLMNAGKEMLFDAAFDVAVAAVFGTSDDNTTENDSSSDKITRKESMFIRYVIEIQGVRFEVSKRGYDALIETVRYRAYYLPLSKVLINIEPLAYNYV
ncbi:hypothetical protein BH18ACI1_BH18ACI1_24040 [soil metagenome]